MEVSPQQYEKASSPIEVILEGIVIEENAHLENVLFPIDVILEGIFTEVRLKQKEYLLLVDYQYYTL